MGGLLLWLQIELFWALLKLSSQWHQQLAQKPYRARTYCAYSETETMDEEHSVSPDLTDIETKLGRKVPDGLVRSLAGGRRGDRHEHDKSAAPHLANCKFCANSADLKKLQNKMLFLRQEMANLRAIDVKLMQQLLSINDGIESIRWIMEDKEDMTSLDGSLTGSLYSLSDSQDGSSLQDSFNSLNDGNGDGLDSLSVGSYLDTLAEDLPGDSSSPTDLDCLMDKAVISADSFTKSPLKLRVESDEYYCFR